MPQLGDGAAAALSRPALDYDDLRTFVLTFVNSDDNMGGSFCFLRPRFTVAVQDHYAT